MTDETKDSKALPDLQETALNDELIRFSRGYGSDFYNVGQQMTGILPPLSSAFMMLGSWPNSLATGLESLSQRNITLRRGAMAMHLRREAHIRYLREGNEDILTQVESDIDALSPYYQNPIADQSAFESYLTFLFPYCGVRWSIKQLNQDLQNKRVLHITPFVYPEKDSPLRLETDDGHVELEYVNAAVCGKKTDILYTLTVSLHREPPASYANATLSSQSGTVIGFNLHRLSDTPFLTSITLKGVVVRDALERLVYSGGLSNVEMARFLRLIHDFLGVHGTVEPAHLESANRWFTGTVSPPIQMVLGSGFEKLPDTWKEGDEKPLLLEDHPAIQSVFFGEGTRPLGENVPHWVTQASQYDACFLGVETHGDLPFMAVSSCDGHRLAYAEWQHFAPGATLDDAPVCRTSHFVLAIDKGAMIVGHRDHGSLMEGYWTWTIKGRDENQGTWVTFSVTPAAYAAIITYLKQARDGYREALQNSVMWPQITAGVEVNRWEPLRFDTEQRGVVRKLKDQGFVSIREEIRTYDFGRYFRELFDVMIS